MVNIAFAYIGSLLAAGVVNWACGVVVVLLAAGLGLLWGQLSRFILFPIGVSNETALCVNVWLFKLMFGAWGIVQGFLQVLMAKFIFRGVGAEASWLIVVTLAVLEVVGWIVQRNDIKAMVRQNHNAGTIGVLWEVSEFLCVRRFEDHRPAA